MRFFLSVFLLQLILLASLDILNFLIISNSKGNFSLNFIFILDHYFELFIRSAALASTLSMPLPFIYIISTSNMVEYLKIRLRRVLLVFLLITQS